MSAPVGTPPAEQAGPTARPARQRSVRRTFASTVLASEALIVGFAGLAVLGLRHVDPALASLSPGTIGAITGGGALACLLTAGLLRSPIGYVLGTLVQLVLILSGRFIPMMYVIAGVFTLLWVVSLWLGAKIDREKAERAAREPSSASSASSTSS